MALASLLAQCTSSAPCDIPRGLPWWMAGAIFVVWLAAVVAAIVLARRRLALRAERRRERERHAHREIDRSTPGHDVEPW